MQKVIWLLGGTLLAMGVLALLDIPYPVFAGDNEVSNWGRKQQLSGAGGQLKGKAKQGVGNVIGHDGLASEGALDEVAGTVRRAVGKAATAVGDGVRSVTK